MLKIIVLFVYLLVKTHKNYPEICVIVKKLNGVSKVLKLVLPNPVKELEFLILLYCNRSYFGINLLMVST